MQIAGDEIWRPDSKFKEVRRKELWPNSDPV